MIINKKQTTIKNNWYDASQNLYDSAIRRGLDCGGNEYFFAGSKNSSNKKDSYLLQKGLNIIKHFYIFSSLIINYLTK